MNGDVTQLLQAIEAGDDQAPEQLYHLVYDELRRLAQDKMARESGLQTLQPTALVHEAYLRMMGGEPDAGWDNRRHFFAAAAETMRRLLVEAARRRSRLKRGGHLQRDDFEESQIVSKPPHEDLLALDEALARLEAEEPAKAELVKLRYFAGLSIEESAAALGISRATAARYWTYAKAWLFDSLTGIDA